MNDGVQQFRFAVVLLAAGRSRRMGTSKLLLPWKGTSVLGHLLELWRELGAQQVAVVCAGDRTDVTDELDRLEFNAADRIVNPEPDRGMFSSIQCAARWSGWMPGLTHWAIALGDQPHLAGETLSRLSQFTAVRPGRICQPTYAGHKAHPVFLPWRDFRELATTDAVHLKQFLEEREVAMCEIDDPGLVWDIDTPEDYRRISGG